MVRVSPERIVLVHWKAGAELEERRARLESEGYEDEGMYREGGAPYRRMRDDPPAAVVIDLSRLPSHGRHLGVAIRERKSTASLPIVFVDGVPDKVARVKDEVPNAIFTDWARIASAIERAKKAPIPIESYRSRAGERRSRRRDRASSRSSSRASSRSTASASASAGYSGTPLPKKLGIVEDTRLALLAAPKHLPGLLGPLPEGVQLRHASRGKNDVLLLFCRDLATLEKRLGPATRAMADGASLWIAWPKKSSALATKDLSGDVVRASGLETGLVDTKVCAIDEDWSGLRFQRRRDR